MLIENLFYSFLWKFLIHSSHLQTSALLNYYLIIQKSNGMKPENILQSDILDIVFENKNKNYGAYELRKQYAKRLMKSVSITISVVLVFALLMSWKVPHKRTGFLSNLEGVELKQIEIEKSKPKEQSKPKPVKDVAQIKNVVPVIVKDAPTDVPENEDLKNKIISSINKNGADMGDEVVPPPSENDSGNGNANIEPAKEEITILTHSEIMPQFPGGIESLKKFIQRNTRQPDDLEDGQKVVVIASFVVDASGNITQINIDQKGRKDLDEEVLRVIKKMPQWEPGKQNGRAVSVYFRLPITFMPQE